MPIAAPRREMNVGAHAAGFRRWLRLVRRYGRPERVCYFDGGIGDQLLCSTVAREWQRRARRNLWFFTHTPELFAHNPDFTAVLEHDWWLVPWLRLTGTQVQRLSYQDHLGGGQDAPLREHLIAALCRRAGIAGQVTLRPWLPGVALTRTARPRPQVAVQSSCLSARYPILNKQWPIERMQEVVAALAPRVDFLQVGAAADPLLAGVVDRRGETLLSTARLLADCDLFVGLVGFVMHLARAVECPAVVVYGGRELPEFTGYAANVNFDSRPPCSPCWYYSHCDFERRCLTAITSEAVVAGIGRILTAPPARPLREETANLAA